MAILRKCKIDSILWVRNNMDLREKFEYWLDIAQYDDINSLVTKFEGILPSVIDDDKRLLFAKLSAFYLNNDIRNTRSY